MGRPAKSLEQLVKDGTFRARRDTHRELLACGEVQWVFFADLQRRYRQAASEDDRRAIALTFEKTVQKLHAETHEQHASATEFERLQAELAELGPADSAKQVINFFEHYLTHTKGRDHGKPFLLESWQKAFIRELYRRDTQGERLWSRCTLGVPRGNGKTPLAAGLALYELLTRGDAPDILLASATREQADIAFEFARQFVESGPLSDWIETSSKRLTCAATRGSIRTVSAVGANQHGLMPSVVIVDELWAMQTRDQKDLLTAFISALHKRDDSYLLALTTAGYTLSSELGRIYDDALTWPERTTSKSGCLTVAKNPDSQWLLYWYGAPTDADHDEPRIWRACNPASWITAKSLHRQHADISLNPAEFRRLHLNQFVASRDSFLPAGVWAKLDDQLEIPEQAEIFVGVDIALTGDTSAVAWCWREPSEDVFVLRAHVWAAREKADAHEYSDDETVHLREIEQFIVELHRRYRIWELAYDPRYFVGEAQRLHADYHFPVVEYSAGSAPLLDATQRFRQLALEQQIAHDGDPVLAAHIEATAARLTEQGLKLYKLQNKRPIDATIASILAVRRAELTNPKDVIPNIFWMDA